MPNNYIVKEEESGQRLDVFLKEYIFDVSREKIKRAILAGQVSVNGQLIDDPNYRVKAAEEIQLSIELKPYQLEPQAASLKKVFENEDFVIIDKPAGMVVHPGANVTDGTLAHALLAEYPSIANVGHPLRPGIVHRLDKDTSGLMLVAKNDQAFEYAKELFKSRNISKEYETLVAGKVNDLHGFIEKPLILVPEHRRVEVSENGRPAKTEYRNRGWYRDTGSLDFYTLLRVILHTGRTHQIRVHFSSLGHPLAGDQVYGKGRPIPKGLTRQFLHAKRLAFKLPDGTDVDVESALPDDLKEVLNNLEHAIS